MSLVPAQAVVAAQAQESAHALATAPGSGAAGVIVIDAEATSALRLRGRTKSTVTVLILQHLVPLLRGHVVAVLQDLASMHLLARRGQGIRLLGVPLLLRVSHNQILPQKAGKSPLRRGGLPVSRTQMTELT